LAISTGNCRNSSSQFKQPFWLLGCLLHWNDKLKEQKLKGHVFNFAFSFAFPVGDALTCVFCLSYVDFCVYDGLENLKHHKE
jgi:hypothetical protein